MKRLFIVGVKLLGLLCLWWAIFTTLQIISYGGMILGLDRPGTRWVLAAILYGTGLLAYVVFSIWFAVVLLFRTEWVAEKVGLGEDTQLPGWPEEKKLLILGVVLLGLYVLADAIPGFAKSLLSLFGTFFLGQPPGYRNETTLLLMRYVIPLLKDILQVAVGGLLILMPVRIIGWLERWQEALDRKLTASKETAENGTD